MGLRYALRILYRNSYYLEGTLSVIDRVVDFVPGAIYAKYAEFLETVEGVKVLLLSVLSNIGSRGYRGSKPKSIKGSNNFNNSLKAIRGGVNTLINYIYASGATIKILTLIRYYLAIAVELGASIKVSYLLLEAYSLRTNIKGVGFKSYITLLTALIQRLLQVSRRLVLLIYYTPKGVSSI